VPSRSTSERPRRSIAQAIEIYRDAGISGAKGRDGRPGLDDMLKDACRRKFDVVIPLVISCGKSRPWIAQRPDAIMRKMPSLFDMAIVGPFDD
jgi:Resolvase, N terminal domain